MPFGGCSNVAVWRRFSLPVCTGMILIFDVKMTKTRFNRIKKGVTQIYIQIHCVSVNVVTPVDWSTERIICLCLVPIVSDVMRCRKLLKRFIQFSWLTKTKAFTFETHPISHLKYSSLANPCCLLYPSSTALNWSKVSNFYCLTNFYLKFKKNVHIHYWTLFVSPPPKVPLPVFWKWKKK